MTAKDKVPRMQLIALLKKALPESHRITDIWEHPETEDVSFKWRGIAFRVNTRLEVFEHFGTHGHGLLMQALLRCVHARRFED